MKRALVTTLTFLFATFSINAMETFRIVTVEWPPYISKDLPEHGPFTKDLKDKLEKKNIKLELVYRPWARAVKEARDGLHDAIFPEYYNESRAKDFFYTKALADGPVGLFAVENSRALEDETSLAGKRIGLVRGYVNTPIIDNDRSLIKDFAISDEDNIRKLCSGRVDMIFIDDHVLEFILDTMKRKGEQCPRVKKIGLHFEKKKFYIIIPKNNKKAKEFLDIVNQTLEQRS